MDARVDELRVGLTRFLTAHWRPDVEVSSFAHVPGGASRETWLFQAASGDTVRGMVVRIDPDSSLIETDRRTEYRATEAAFKAGLPAPEPLFLVESPDWLGRPFSISAEVSGCRTAAETIPAEHRQAIGRQKWSILGRLAALDPEALGLGDVMHPTTPEACALQQLEYWARVIAEDEIHPNPVAHAAIRWLQRNPPPPAQKLALVHGDFRTGNFLYSPDGEIKAILDWEMAHFGDPLEDLAWSFDPLWSWAEPELAGRCLPHAEALCCWEAASGTPRRRPATSETPRSKASESGFPRQRTSTTASANP
jgi:aminoglycoside phosphotransferase (APT) family kinase protein